MTLDALSLGQKRRLFSSQLLPQLLAEMVRRGYEVSLSTGFVDPGVTGSPHLTQGCHPKGLAEDINLHRCAHVPAHLLPCPLPDYLMHADAHRPFGAFWKGLHPLCRWGGDFPSVDANHYSLEDGGVA